MTHNTHPETPHSPTLLQQNPPSPYPPIAPSPIPPEKVYTSSTPPKMADPKTTKPSEQSPKPDPTSQTTPTSSLRSRIFSMTHRPKTVFKRHQPPTPPSPEGWRYVTRNYQGKDNSLRGNLPESMSDEDASRKLDWIDRRLIFEQAEEQTAGGGAEGDEKWSKRVFWDRRREEIWKRAGGKGGSR